MSDFLVEQARPVGEQRPEPVDVLARLDARPVLSGSLVFAVGLMIGDVVYGLAILIAVLAATFGTTRLAPRSSANRFVLTAGASAMAFGLAFGQLADYDASLSLSLAHTNLPLNRVEVVIMVAPVLGIVWGFSLAALVIRAFRLRECTGGSWRDFVPQAVAVAGAMLTAVLLLGWLDGFVLIFVAPAILAASKRAQALDQRDEVLLGMTALFSGAVLAIFVTEYVGLLGSATLTAAVGVILHAANAWLALLAPGASRRAG